MSASFTCPRCGNSLPNNEGRYDEQGELVCRACLAVGQVEQQTRALEQAEREAPKRSDIIFGSLGALMLAIMSLFLRHRYIIFLFPLVALALAVFVLYQPTMHKDIRASLGWKIFPHYAMALLALLISCLGLIVAGDEYRDRQQELRRNIVFEEGE